MSGLSTVSGRVEDQVRHVVHSPAILARRMELRFISQQQNFLSSVQFPELEQQSQVPTQYPSFQSNRTDSQTSIQYAIKAVTKPELTPCMGIPIKPTSIQPSDESSKLTTRPRSPVILRNFFFRN